jgi:hypothetical protein
MGSPGKGALTLAALLLASCQVGGQSRPPTDPSSHPVSPVATPRAVLGGMAARQAWPRVNFMQIPATLADGRELVPLQVTSSPEWLVASVGRTGSGDPTTDAMVLYNTSTRAVEQMRATSSPKDSALYADADDRWVTWIEASDSEFADWHLYAYDRTAKTSRLVAKAPLLPDGKPPSTINVQPKIGAGYVAWSNGTTETPVGHHVDSWIARLDGTEPPRLLAKDAALPVISWPQIAYVQHSGALYPDGVLQLMRSDLTTSKTDPYPGVVSPKYWTIHGSRLAWIDKAGKVLRLRQQLDGADDVLMDVSSDITNSLQWPTMTDQLLAWSASGGDFVFDLRHRTLVRLNSHTLFGFVYVGGDSLGWLNVLDDRTKSPPAGVGVWTLVNTREIP